jgi:hypothetical protein
VLTHSDDDSTYTNVADADMLGVTGITGGIIKSLIAAHAAATVSLRLQGRQALPEAARRLQRHPRHRHADRRLGAAVPRCRPTRRCRCIGGAARFFFTSLERSLSWPDFPTPPKPPFSR